MKEFRGYLALLLFICFVIGSAAGQAEHLQVDFSYPHTPNRLIVKMKSPGSKPDTRVGILSKSMGSQFHVIEVPAGASLRSAQQVLEMDENVAYAEPDYTVYATDEGILTPPNDPRFSEQWALQNTGQNGGLSGDDINALDMWSLAKGDGELVLAVFDTGVDYTHPDLAPNMWTNTGKTEGYVGDVHGINAITHSGDPMDDNGHGTHVAGIMSAVSGNGIGIAGVVQAKILPCKFLDSDGSGEVSGAVECINYVLSLSKRQDNPVSIVAINNSWAGGPYSQALHDSILELQQAGILFIAAAGNYTENNDLIDIYPANYPIPAVVSVAATDNKNALAGFSNFGAHTVDLAAPGVSILSTLPSNQYGERSGTSMATPFVTGMAGLIKSYHPDMDWRSIRNLLLAGSKKSPSTQNTTISGGILRGADMDGVGSLTCADQILSRRLQPISDAVAVKVGSPVLFSQLNINCAEANGAISLTSLSDNSATPMTDSDGVGIYSASVTPSSLGTTRWQIGADDIVMVSTYSDADWQAYQAQVQTAASYQSITGTALHMVDNGVRSLVLPFPIQFAYGQSLMGVLYVGANGTLSFTDGQIFDQNNSTLPAANVESLIAVNWGKLSFGKNPGAGVYYDVIGTAPSRQLVLEWRNMAYLGVGGSTTFQVIFNENSSDILFNYKNGRGPKATIGIQAAQHTALLSLTDNKLSSASSILFTKSTSAITDSRISQTPESGYSPPTIPSTVDVQTDTPVPVVESPKPMAAASDPLPATPAPGCQQAGAASGGPAGLLLGFVFTMLLVSKRRFWSKLGANVILKL